MKTKILVTGAQGQLAKTINDLYSKNLDDLEFVFVSKNELDITNKTEMSSFFKTHLFNYCINCAAYTNVEQSEIQQNLAFQVNAEAVKFIAEVCKNQNVILIHISTDYVFDGQKQTPYTINDLPNPLNVYGNSKLSGENYIQKTMSDFFVIRTSWLYSKTYGHNFYKTILRKARNKESIKVVDNQVSRPTNCEDLAKHIYGIIKNSSKKYGLHHFSGKNELSWFGFAQQILKENNLLDSTKIVVDNSYKTLAKRPKYSVLENTSI